MDNNKLEYYKNKLIKERKNVKDLILQMKKNEVINSKAEIASELSLYDNHPSDIATEINDMEKGMAFKQNEVHILKKIDNALLRIEEHKYGICKQCGKPINEERLEFIPYAENCVECQERLSSIKPRDINDRPVEEEVLRYPFGVGYKGNSNNIGFDLEDSYDAVDSYNRLEDEAGYYYDDTEYVDKMDSISNEQYKNQLPD